MSARDVDQHVAALLKSADVRFCLKERISRDANRDPVDAYQDAKLLLDVASRRLDALGIPVGEI